MDRLRQYGSRASSEETNATSLRLDNTRNVLTSTQQQGSPTANENQYPDMDESEEVDVESMDQNSNGWSLSTEQNVEIRELRTKLEMALQKIKDAEAQVKQLKDERKRNKKDEKLLHDDLDKERQKSLQNEKKVKCMVKCMKFVSGKMTEMTEKLKKKSEEDNLMGYCGPARVSLESGESVGAQNCPVTIPTQGEGEEEQLEQDLKERLNNLETVILRRENRHEERAKTLQPFALFLAKGLVKKKPLVDLGAQEVATTSRESVFQLSALPPVSEADENNGGSGTSLFQRSSMDQSLHSETRTNQSSEQNEMSVPQQQPGTSRQQYVEMVEEDDDDDDIMIIEPDGTLTLPKQPPAAPQRTPDGSDNDKNDQSTLLHIVKVEEGGQPVEQPRKIHKKDLTKRGTTDSYYCTCGVKFGKREKGLYSHIRFWNGGYIKKQWNLPRVSPSGTKRAKRTPKIYTEEEKKFSCVLCGERFIGISNRKLHMKKEHKVEDHSNEIGCRACGSTFLLWSDFYHHRKQIHGKNGGQQVPSSNPLATSALPGPSSTNVNNYTLPPPPPLRISNIIAQQSRPKHGVDKSKAAILGYFCKCGTWHMSESSLTAHISNMNSQIQFTCRTCQRSFKTTAALLVHMQKFHKKNLEESKVGNKVAPFRCCCGKGFYHADMFKKHCRIYAHRQIYKCSQCVKSFPDNGKLIEHEQISHGVIVL